MLPLPIPASAEDMFDLLASIFALEEGVIEDLWSVTTFIDVKKGTILLKPGEICDTIYFVSEGLLRCYYVLERKGKEDIEVTTWLMREKDICTSVHSYYSQTKSIEYIQTLEPCRLYCIKYDPLEMVYDRYPRFNKNGRLLTAKYLVEWAAQLRDIRLLKGAERFYALWERDPELVLRVPQKYLATFLDMRPTSLSRALKTVTKKK